MPEEIPVDPHSPFWGYVLGHDEDPLQQLLEAEQEGNFTFQGEQHGQREEIRQVRAQPSCPDEPFANHKNAS